MSVSKIVNYEMFVTWELQNVKYNLTDFKYLAIYSENYIRFSNYESITKMFSFKFAFKKNPRLKKRKCIIMKNSSVFQKNIIASVSLSNSSLVYNKDANKIYV